MIMDGTEGSVRGELIENTNGKESAGKASFRDTLINKQNGGVAVDQEDDISIGAEDVVVSHFVGAAQISFSNRVHEFFASSMKRTIFVKVLGKAVGYRSLYAQLLKLWRPAEVWSMVDVGFGCFMVRFEKDSDYIQLLACGPWMIYGHYLVVQPWHPNFEPFNFDVKSVVAWIHFPNLPIQFYAPSVLRAIAGVVGEVIKIDKNTETNARGRYAVNINLKKPLVSMIEIEGRAQNVEYEGLTNICFQCGMFGHVKENCPLNKKSDVDMGEGKGGDGNPGEERLEAAKECEYFGPWMQVARRENRGGYGGRKPGVLS